MRAKYGTKYKGDDRLDGGGSTRRSLCSDSTVGWLVGDHFLCVQLLYVCGCLRLRRTRHALLATHRARSALSGPPVCSALVPPRALPVFGAGARSCMFVCMRLRRARRDNAVTGCKNCHADAQKIQATQPHLFLRPFTFISRVTRHNKHTHDDTYREDIQRFQRRSLWLQWRSQRPTTTTAGSSPRIT